MQHTSTKLRSVEQLPLLSAPKHPQGSPDIAKIRRLSTFLKALQYAMELSEMEPKEVYEPLDKDKATWSRIEHGDMGFPADLLLPFDKLVQNDVLLLWLVHQSGYDITRLQKLQDDKDRRIAELEAENAQLLAERQTIVKFVQETQR